MIKKKIEQIKLNKNHLQLCLLNRIHNQTPYDASSPVAQLPITHRCVLFTERGKLLLPGNEAQLSIRCEAASYTQNFQHYPYAGNYNGEKVCI